MKKYSAKLIVVIFYVLGGFILFEGCDKHDAVISQFNRKAQLIHENYIPDPALDIFQFEIIKEGKTWLLKGETTNPEVNREIVVLADSLFSPGNYRNEFVRLPHPSLGDSIYGIISVSVANIREEPRHGAQLIDQNIMGHRLDLLKYNRGWYFIRTEYGYLGWMTRDSFIRIDSLGLNEWVTSGLLRVTDLYPLVFSGATQNAEPLTDVVLNAYLKLEKGGTIWSQVSTPDGRMGYILTSAISDGNKDWKTEEILRKNVILSARGMMGIPYLWGGNSSKASDCSGFIQTIFKANGVDLPRDSRQQALLGEEVFPDSTFSNILPGDLLFFGSRERVTHVGISLGGTQFIHQGGRVDINSLDPDAPDYSPSRHKSLKFIKRIL